MKPEDVIREYAKKLSDALKDIYITSFRRGARDAKKQLKKEINEVVDKQIYDEAVNYFSEQKDWIESHLVNTDETVVHEKLHNAITEGQNFEQFWQKTRDSGMFDRTRAQRIFRTETARSYNEGALRTYKSEGVTHVKIELGPNPCPMCESIANEGPWEVEQVFGLTPIHPNCSCVFINAKAAIPARPSERLGHQDYKWSLTDAEYKAAVKAANKYTNNIPKDILTKWPTGRSTIIRELYEKYMADARLNVNEEAYHAGNRMWSSWSGTTTSTTGTVLKIFANKKISTAKPLFSSATGYIDRKKSLLNAFNKMGREELRDICADRSITETELLKYYDYQYIFTQAALKKVYGESVTLYRGVSGRQWRSWDEPIAGSKKLKMNALSSWSDNLEQAKKFGIKVIKMETPITDIQTSYLNGDFASFTIEQEFVVYGGVKYCTLMN